MRTYRELFSVYEFRALWASTAFTTAASTMSSLALAVVIHEETGSALLAATTMFGPSLMQVLGATTLMSMADASPPRRTLMLVGVVVAVAGAIQALLSLPPLGRMLVVFGAAYIVSLGSGVRWGLLSELLPNDAYPLARSTMNLAVGVFQVVGYAGAGALLTILDPPQILWLSAALATAAVVAVRRGVTERPARRRRRAGLAETWRGNGELMRQPGARALLVALALPNGLIVGCEALFVPYAGNAAGLLLASVAGGMMAGDLVVGRFLSRRGRQLAGLWLRFVLAAPFLLFVAKPAVPVAAVLAAVGAAGYAASLSQQEQLVAITAPELRGQVLGAESALRMTLQGVCAILAGALGEIWSVPVAIALLAAASLLSSIILTPSLVLTSRSLREANAG